MKIRGRTDHDDGFTVIELTVAAALSMILLMSALSLLDGATRTERRTQARLDVVVSLRDAMAQTTKEARQALTIDATSTRSKLVMDTLVGGATHHVIFEVSGTDYRVTDTTVGGTARTIVRHVSMTQPFCYDPNATPPCAAASPSSPTSIQITIAATPEVLSGGPITLSSDVQLRNIR